MAIALALAYVALASGDRVMIRVVGGVERPRPAPVFVLDATGLLISARSLSAIKSGGATDLAPALAHEMVSIRRAGKVFLISDFLMNPAECCNRALGLFSASNMDVTAIQVSRAALNSRARASTATSRWWTPKAASGCASRSAIASANNIAKRCCG